MPETVEASSRSVSRPQNPRFSVATGSQVATALREELRRCVHAIALLGCSNVPASETLVSGLELKCVRASGDMRPRLRLDILRIPQR